MTDPTGYPGVHGACFASRDDLVRRFANEVRRAHLQAGADAAIGRELRWLLAPGNPRKTFRREELQALIEKADRKFPDKGEPS